jgi:hypothetical protein
MTMANKYTEKVSDSGWQYIEKNNEDGTFSTIPKDPANSDYQRYLRWLKNPDAEENGTIS